ncbi:MAG: alpha/beta hydrolase [Burkholderiales bacterium]|nr:alpha/beta hydrolase [Burkholderiales bacterium]
MNIEVNGHTLYAYTGGKPFNPAQPTLVFIHGVLNDHSVWILQSRFFAHHGWNVLAIDQPGHGRSSGPAPKSVADVSAAVLGLLDALGVQQAALAGHSFGSLIALHTAATAPERVSHLIMVGTAFPMRVSPALLDASLNQPEKAIAMVNVFSHSTLSPPPSALGPGTWLYGGSQALMRRVLASNTAENVFHTGFSACDSYADGEADMAAVRCPVAFILGDRDQMTPPKAAQSLVKGARATGQPVSVATLPAGHSLMTEDPEGTLAAMRAFLGA